MFYIPPQEPPHCAYVAQNKPNIPAYVASFDTYFQKDAGNARSLFCTVAHLFKEISADFSCPEQQRFYKHISRALEAHRENECGQSTSPTPQCPYEIFAEIPTFSFVFKKQIQAVTGIGLSTTHFIDIEALLTLRNYYAQYATEVTRRVTHSPNALERDFIWLLASTLHYLADTFVQCPEFEIESQEERLARIKPLNDNDLFSQRHTSDPFASKVKDETLHFRIRIIDSLLALLNARPCQEAFVEIMQTLVALFPFERLPESNAESLTKLLGRHRKLHEKYRACRLMEGWENWWQQQAKENYSEFKQLLLDWTNLYAEKAEAECWGTPQNVASNFPGSEKVTHWFIKSLEILKNTVSWKVMSPSYELDGFSRKNPLEKANLIARLFDTATDSTSMLPTPLNDAVNAYIYCLSSWAAYSPALAYCLIFPALSLGSDALIAISKQLQSGMDRDAKQYFAMPPKQRWEKLFKVAH